MENNFTITGAINNKKEYNTIKRFIIQDLLKHKNLLPSNLKIVLYDFEDYSNQSGLQKNGKGHTIDINLKEILRLYKRGAKFLNRKDTKYLPEFRNFKKWLLFVLYHELGHYNLKHCFDMDYYFMYRNKCEIEADKFGLKILGIKIYS